MVGFQISNSVGNIYFESDTLHCQDTLESIIFNQYKCEANASTNDVVLTGIHEFKDHDEYTSFLSNRERLTFDRRVGCDYDYSRVSFSTDTLSEMGVKKFSKYANQGLTIH